MNDLAADLRAAANEFADDPAAYLDRGDAYDAMADRLIDLGWTRLDEERLARAMHLARHNHSGLPMWADDTCGPTDYDIQQAAAIAKAYREDTDD
jgi:hypothetical protein